MKGFRVVIRRLIPYKDLLLVYIWREFNVRYRHSVIGVLWAIIQPLSLMLLFTFIFSYVLKIEMKGYPKTVFFYAGLLPWTFFASSMNYSIPSLSRNYELITKIYFPREIIPLAGIFVAFIDFLIASVLFLVMLFIYDIQITWSVLWLPPLLFLLLLFTIAVSLFLSSLNVYYRDVQLATSFLIRLLFFASPVIYSIDGLTVKLKLLLFLNPLTFIIENIRRCVVEGREVVLWQFLVVGVIISVFYLLSYRFFIRTERNFADVI